MGLGLIGQALAGGLAEAGTQAGEYLQKSTLQDEAAKIQAQRDATLNEYARSMETDIKQPGEDRRLGVKEAGNTARNAATNATQVTTTGMTVAGHDKVATEDRAARVSEGGLDRTSRETLERERIASQDRYHNASLAIQSAAEGRLKTGADLDNAIKTIGVANAQRVAQLKIDFTNASPERKTAINEEIQLLTGKDNDKYMPVAVTDANGIKTGEYKIFDTKSGNWKVPTGGATPYAEGAKLKGKDGKDYVVQGGKPVLADSAAPAPAWDAPSKAGPFVNQPAGSATPAPAAPAPAASAAGGDMQAQYDIEQKEMDGMKRSAFSEPVRTWLKEQSDRRAAARSSQSEAAKKSELEKAQAESRARTGR